MKNVKKLLALLLAVVMVVSVLAACNNETPEDTKPSETKGQDSGNNETKPQETESSEPVKLTFMFANGEIVENSIGWHWVKQIEEHCNVEIEWICPPTSGYEDQLQLMLLEEDRPDAIIFPTNWMDSASFADAVNAGMFTDIAGMIENYPNIMEHTAAASWEALDIFEDGRIWGVPRSTVMRADGWHVNEQWLEAIGSDYVEGDLMTLDELFDVLYKFTYEDPDGNGVDDTYGVRSYAKDDGTVNTGFEHIFGLGNGSEFYMIDGEPVMLKYSKEHDNYKKYLEFMNKCWEAGVIDPDAFALDNAASQDRWNANITGMWCQYAGNMQVEPSDTNPATYVYLPGVVEKEGDTFGFGEFATGVYWYWSISNTCEHPEKVLEIFDYILSDEQWTNLNAGSVEGIGFEINADGSYDFSKTDALKEQGLDSVVPIKLIMRRATGAEFFISKKLPPEQQERLSSMIDYAFEYYVAPVDGGYVPAVATDPVFIEYEAYMAQEVAKIITGEEPVDHWDEILEGWYNAGGQSYIDEVTAYINSKNSK